MGESRFTKKFSPLFPEWNDGNFRKILCGPYPYNASGTRAIENALDIVHFPYVHEGLLGDKTHTEIKDYEVEITNDGLWLATSKFGNRIQKVPATELMSITLTES